MANCIPQIEGMAEWAIEWKNFKWHRGCILGHRAYTYTYIHFWFSPAPTHKTQSTRPMQPQPYIPTKWIASIKRRSVFVADWKMANVHVCSSFFSCSTFCFVFRRRRRRRCIWLQLLSRIPLSLAECIVWPIDKCFMLLARVCVHHCYCLHRVRSQVDNAIEREREGEFSFPNALLCSVRFQLEHSWSLISIIFHFWFYVLFSRFHSRNLMSFNAMQCQLLTFICIKLHWCMSAHFEWVSLLVQSFSVSFLSEHRWVDYVDFRGLVSHIENDTIDFHRIWRGCFLFFTYRLNAHRSTIVDFYAEGEGDKMRNQFRYPDLCITHISELFLFDLICKQPSTCQSQCVRCTRCSCSRSDAKRVFFDVGGSFHCCYSSIKCW